MLGAIFERFVEHSPVSVMARGLMERVFARSSMDDLFEATAEVQYTRELLFSSVVELMSVSGVRDSPIGSCGIPSQSKRNEREFECPVRQTQWD